MEIHQSGIKRTAGRESAFLGWDLGRNDHTDEVGPAPRGASDAGPPSRCSGGPLSDNSPNCPS
ncbi:hypothetical protein JCM9534A_43960 [Catenuloplanes indicus JCM 9534]|uniref:Uncharacterized protein n=1 Tax=Catenuloplanes indicus TaxID=137267 RepID=A0AAE4B1B9_9ACTN|nr:hypothetical protein [Catenuloplanes indicus]